MERKITQADVQAVLDATQKATGKPVRICYRDEKAPSIYWLIINTFFTLLAKVYPRMGSFSQGMGHTIMFPTRKEYGDLTDARAYVILRHECVHIRDQSKWSILYLLSYALLLPFLCSMRAFWEFRGYAQNLIVLHELYGDIPDNYLEWIGSHFWGAPYLWMFPFKRVVLRKLKTLRARILKGEVEGLYPKINFWTI